MPFLKRKSSKPGLSRNDPPAVTDAAETPAVTPQLRRSLSRPAPAKHAPLVRHSSSPVAPPPGRPVASTKHASANRASASSKSSSSSRPTSSGRPTTSGKKSSKKKRPSASPNDEKRDNTAAVLIMNNGFF